MWVFLFPNQTINIENIMLIYQAQLNPDSELFTNSNLILNYSEMKRSNSKLFEQYICKLDIGPLAINFRMKKIMR